MELENKIMYSILGGIVCLVAGITIGTAIPLEQEVRIFQREEGKPAVARIYKTGPDSIAVQDSTDKDKYLDYQNYLDTIKDPADREIERAEILKAVEWYKESKK